jgi:hypothetical protein
LIRERRTITCISVWKNQRMWLEGLEMATISMIGTHSQW